jgi:sRNA-binding protein
MFLVNQTDPLMTQVRAQYERDKAAAQKRQQAQKTVRTNTKETRTTKATAKTQQTTRKKSTQTANDNIPYKPRNTTRTRVDDGASTGVGAFAAGALLGTAVGVAIGKD